ncbi:MAG: aconitase X [Candidatus Nezhaarchaeales archaeon]
MSSVKSAENLVEKMKATLLDYGKVYGSERLVECKSCHFVTSCGLRFVKSMFTIMQKLADAGLKCKVPLTANPRPLDTKAYPLLERLVGSYLYGKQSLLESLLLKLGLISRDAFTCTPYYIGNKPEYGEVVAWAESSAVIYANSVIGARTNRNSAMIELFSGILGLTPEFGLLLDENRKASWLIEVKTTSRPKFFVLGSLIGKTILEDIPYIVGLDRWDVNEYELKDMGAAMASWGAVGLFHVEEVTPEAKEKERSKLLEEGYRRLVVDDLSMKEMEALMRKGEHDSEPDLIVIGCPHLSKEQIADWVRKVEGRRFTRRTLMLAAPKIIDEVKNSRDYMRLQNAGVCLSSICPLMFTNIPITKRLRIVTNSGKLAYYSHAIFMDDSQLLEKFTAPA